MDYIAIGLPKIEKAVINKAFYVSCVVIFVSVALVLFSLALLYKLFGKTAYALCRRMAAKIKKICSEIDFRFFVLQKNKSQKRYRDILGLVCIVFIAAWITSLFALYGELDPHHDGFIFKTSLDVARGKTMYRETYSQYGILVFYINAFFINIFGETILTIKMVTALMYTLSFGVLYIIANRFFSVFYSIVICLTAIGMASFYYSFFLPWSSVYALCFLLLSLHFFLLFIDTEKYRYISLCAVSAAITFWMRQPVGIVLVAAFYLILLLLLAGKVPKRKILKSAILYFISQFVVNALMFCMLIAQKSLRDWWIQSISMMNDFAGVGSAFSGGGTFFDFAGTLFRNLFLINPATQKQSLVWTVLPCICLTVLIVYLVLCFKKKKSGDKKEVNEQAQLMMIITIYSLASWHQYYPVSEQSHLYWAAFPMFIVAGYVMRYVAGLILYGILKAQRKFYVELLGAVFIVSMFSGCLIYRMKEAYIKLSQDYMVVHNEAYPFANGIRLSKEIAAFQQSLTDKLADLQNQYETKDILNLTLDGYYSSFSKENITPKFVGASKYYHSEELREDYIRERSPIIIDYEGRPRQGYHLYDVIGGYSGNDHGHRNKVGIYLPDDIQILLLDGFKAGIGGGLYGGQSGKMYVVNNRSEKENVKLEFKVAVLADQEVQLIVKTGDQQSSYKVGGEGAFINETVEVPGNSKIVMEYEVKGDAEEVYSRRFPLRFSETSFFDVVEGICYNDIPNKKQENLNKKRVKHLTAIASKNKKYISIYNDSDKVKFAKLKIKDEDTEAFHKVKLTYDDMEIHWRRNEDGMESIEDFTLFAEAGIEIFCEGIEDIEGIQKKLKVEVSESVEPICVKPLDEKRSGNEFMVENSVASGYYLYYTDINTGKKKRDFIYSFKRKIILLRDEQDITFVRKNVL